MLEEYLIPLIISLLSGTFTGLITGLITVATMRNDISWLKLLVMQHDAILREREKK